MRQCWRRPRGGDARSDDGLDRWSGLREPNQLLGQSQNGLSPIRLLRLARAPLAGFGVIDVKAFNHYSNSPLSGSFCAGVLRNGEKHRKPAQRAVAPQALASTSAEGKPAQQAVMSPSSSTPKRAYSEEQYNRLLQQYKPIQPQADGPLPADRLDLFAQILRGNMEDQEMWPVVADVIYGKASAVEERLDTGRLSTNARLFMNYPYNNFQSLLDIVQDAFGCVVTKE